MQTLSILIGNSDNKLSQQNWAQFCISMGSSIRHHAARLHFYGLSNPDSEYQTACWVVEIEDKDLDSLIKSIAMKRSMYEQDSIAVIYGQTQFI